jgi:hypothetical protein
MKTGRLVQRGYRGCLFARLGCIPHRRYLLTTESDATDTLRRAVAQK